MLADPTYPLYPLFSFLGFIMDLVPLSWHLQAWKSGTCYYMIWTSLSCLNFFINSLIWKSDAINRAPIWCEISIRITMGASIGIPMASLCIVRRLHGIAKLQTVSVTQADKRRAVIIDSFLCVLCPFVFIALQLISQGHRFDIYAGVGCWSAMYNTPVIIGTTFIWPTVIGLISTVYCAFAFVAFRRCQADFSRFLSSNRSLTLSRYFRLMALAMVETACTMPLSVYMLVVNTTIAPIHPWISWDDTHYNYGRVVLVPSFVWRQERMAVIGIELSRWANIFCAFIFFAFFGFAEEARKNYQAAFVALMARLGLNKFIPGKSNSKSFNKATVPSFVQQKELKLPTILASRQSSSTEPHIFNPYRPPLYNPKTSSTDSAGSLPGFFKPIPNNVPLSPLSHSASEFNFSTSINGSLARHTTDLFSNMVFDPHQNVFMDPQSSR